MSEHYDFHYQPTGSGAISGQQVLQQTEDAINELGDYVNDNVGGAMDVAQQALETAQNAEQDAQTALDTANSFSSAIQSAQQDASTALSTAQTAQTTASNANNTAIQAQQDASSAVTTANNALGQVSTLSGTVTTLGQRVTTAEGNIGQNTSDITALTTRVGTAEGNITTLQNEVTIAQGNASSAMATAGTVKQQAFVFRYSSTALVASSTNSNALLDNTDNLKVGDKVIDSSGVLFSITAIDTANSTFTIGTALIDLAQDSDVVHLSGTEDITGSKRFGVVQSFTGYPSIRLYGTTDDINVLPSAAQIREIRFTDKNNVPISYFAFQHRASSAEPFRTCWRQQKVDGTLNYYSVNFNNLGEFYPENDTGIKLGTSTNRWAEVYAQSYYYGSNNVEFSTKFVTTDTAQTISGVKTFSGNLLIYNSDNSADTPRLNIKTSKYVKGDTTNTDTMRINFLDSNGNSVASVYANKNTGGSQYLSFQVYTTDNNNANITSTINYYISKSGDKYFIPYEDSQISLGGTVRRWKSVYATNYYYGSNNVEFSTKFVTTDTAQTISGNKTFSSDLSISNTDTTANTPNLNLRNYKVDRGTTDTGVQTINFLDKNAKALTLIESRRISNGNTGTNILCYNTDDSNNTVSGGISIIKGKNDTTFAPNTDNAVTCGRALAKWSDVVTYKVNGVEPSSLSLPSGNVSDVIDISSYITALDGTDNTYVAPANGWISIAVVGTAIDIVSSSWSDSRLRASSGNVRMLYPVLKNETVSISVVATTLAYARFIPCQGNV